MKKFQIRGDKVGLSFAMELGATLCGEGRRKSSNMVVSVIIFGVHDVFKRFQNIAWAATMSEWLKILLSSLNAVVNRSRTVAMEANVAFKSWTNMKLTAAEISR